MLNGKRITVVMPAYNAEKTLRKTHSEIPHDIVDNIILTDDASQDRTAEVALQLNIKTFVHMENKGYGGNQKTCYTYALKKKADIIIISHIWNTYINRMWRRRQQHCSNNFHRYIFKQYKYNKYFNHYDWYNNEYHIWYN